MAASAWLFLIGVFKGPSFHYFWSGDGCQTILFPSCNEWSMTLFWFPDHARSRSLSQFVTMRSRGRARRWSSHLPKVNQQTGSVILWFKIKPWVWTFNVSVTVWLPKGKIMLDHLVSIFDLEVSQGPLRYPCRSSSRLGRVLVYTVYKHVFV